MTFIDLNGIIFVPLCKDEIIFVAFIAPPAVIHHSGPTEIELVSIQFAAYCRVLRSGGRSVLPMGRIGPRMTLAVPDSRWVETLM